jgi:hypothetical protein
MDGEKYALVVMPAYRPGQHPTDHFHPCLSTGTASQRKIEREDSF